MRNYQSTEHSKNAPDKRKSWGIPELKQYPLDTISDLKTAIAHFKFCPKEYKIHLALGSMLDISPK